MDDVNPYRTPASPSSLDSKPRLLETLFSFHGRVRRRTYWKWNLSMVVIALFVMVLFQPLLFEPQVRPGSPPAMFARLSVQGMIVVPVLAFVSFWIATALGVKRWHDRGKSGWWILISLIPLIGAIWTLVECGCLRGTVGPNPYGEDPT